MDSTPKRPWYRLHWGTVLVVVFVTMCWLSSAHHPTIANLLTGGREPIPAYAQGWPLSWVRFDFVQPPSLAGVYAGDVLGAANTAPTEFHLPALVIDVSLLIGCLLAVAFVVERLGHVRFQFSLSALVGVVTTIAGLMAFWKWNSVPSRAVVSDELCDYIPISLFVWVTAVPTLFALGCAMYTATWFALRAASWLHRPAPPKVEADGSPAA